MITKEKLEEWNDRPIADIEVHLANIVSITTPRATHIYLNYLHNLVDDYTDSPIFAEDSSSETYTYVIGQFTEIFDDNPYRLSIAPVREMEDGGALVWEEKILLAKLADNATDPKDSWVRITCDDEFLYAVDKLNQRTPIAGKRFFLFKRQLVAGWGLSFKNLVHSRGDCSCSNRNLIGKFRNDIGHYCANCYGYLRN